VLVAARVVLEPRVAGSILLTDSVVAPSSGRCGSDSSLASSVASTAVVKVVGQDLGEHVFPLTNLRTVLQTVSLLDEEHVAVVLG